MDPAVIATSITNAWEAEALRGQSSPSKRPYVYASACRDCERRMVLDMVEGDKLPLWTAEQLANFKRGNDRERDLVSDLVRLGRNADPPFEVRGQQERFELKDRNGRVVIVGKTDASIQSNGSALPTEVKAWHPNTVNRIRTFDDLLYNKWTKPASYQLLAYLFGSGNPSGILLLDRHGLPKPIPVELEPNLEQMEGFMQKAERAMDHKEAGTLPDYHDDPDECLRCPFYGSVCNPPLRSKVSQVIADPETIQLMERREELKESAKEYQTIDKALKHDLRGVETAMAGSFYIKGKWGRQTVLCKEHAITKENSKFTLTITRV